MLTRKDLETRLTELAADRARAKEAVEQSQNVLVQQRDHLVRIEGAMLELQEMLKSPLLTPEPESASETR